MTRPIEAILLETARRGELHHAVILHGPVADDLRALSLRIAKTLNCLNGTTGDDCVSCQKIARGLHPDVHVTEVASEKKMISVEQIRTDVVAEAALRPYEGRNKVFVIDPAEGLTPGASNALLKTLEEPARDTHFILIARSPDRLLPTIRSRCQSVYIGGDSPLDESLRSEIRGMLRRFGETGESLGLLAVAARVAGDDDDKEAMALLASLLRDAAAGVDAELEPLRARVDSQRILDAAGGVLEAIAALEVNADSRLMLERALACFVTARP